MAYTPQELCDEDLVLLVGNGAVGVGLLFWLRYEFWVSPERRFPLPSARQATLLFGLRWLCLALAFCLPYFALWSMQHEYRFSFTEVFNWAFVGTLFTYVLKETSWKSLILITLPTPLIFSLFFTPLVYFSTLYYLLLLLVGLGLKKFIKNRRTQTIRAVILASTLPLLTFAVFVFLSELQFLFFDRQRFIFGAPCAETIMGNQTDSYLIISHTEGLFLSFLFFHIFFLPLLHKHFMRLRSKPA